MKNKYALALLLGVSMTTPSLGMKGEYPKIEIVESSSTDSSKESAEKKQKLEEEKKEIVNKLMKLKPQILEMYWTLRGRYGSGYIAKGGTLLGNVIMPDSYFKVAKKNVKTAVGVEPKNVRKNIGQLLCSLSKIEKPEDLRFETDEADQLLLMKLEIALKDGNEENFKAEIVKLLSGPEKAGEECDDKFGVFEDMCKSTSENSKTGKAKALLDNVKTTLASLIEIYKEIAEVKKSSGFMEHVSTLSSYIGRLTEEDTRSVKELQKEETEDLVAQLDEKIGLLKKGLIAHLGGDTEKLPSLRALRYFQLHDDSLYVQEGTQEEKEQTEKEESLVKQIKGIMKDNITVESIHSGEFKITDCLPLFDLLSTALSYENLRFVKQTWSNWIWRGLQKPFTPITPPTEQLTEENVHEYLKIIHEIKLICLALMGQKAKTELLGLTFSAALDNHIKNLEEKKQAFSNFKEKDTVWILSLDGGGTRGLIGATILADFGKKLDPNEELNGKSITEKFDFFAGTSTGGLMALGLTCPEDPIKDINTPLYNTEFLLNLYKEEGETIFPPSYLTELRMLGGVSYSRKGLETLLKKKFLGYSFGQMVKPTLVISVDRVSSGMLPLKSYAPFEKKELYASDWDAYIWQIGRCTSAAPTYLNPLIMTYGGILREIVDGGLAQNDPSFVALGEVLNLCPGVKNIVLVSIGTGNEPINYQISEKKGMAIGDLVVNLAVNTQMQISQDLARKNVESMKNHLSNGKGEKVNLQYFRIQPNLTEKIDLADSSKSTLEKLTQIGNLIVGNKDTMKATSKIDQKPTKEARNTYKALLEYIEKNPEIPSNVKKEGEKKED